MTAFNLDTLAKSDVADIHLRHPATDELLYADEAKTLPVIIEVYGTSSKQYRNAMNALQNKRLKSGRNKPSDSAEALEEENVDLLVKCSKVAKNITYQGKEIKGEVFRDLYNDIKFDWLRQQIDKVIVDHASFLPQ